MADGAEAAIGLETRLSRLETIVSTLEREELELEEALTLFEEGIGHLRKAQETIRAGELRIERLLEGVDGEPLLEGMARGDE